MSSEFFRVPGKISLTALEQTVVCLLIGVLVLNPFPHNTVLTQLLFYASLVPVIIWGRGGGLFYYKSPLFYPLSLFFFWSLVSAFSALDKAESFRDIYSHLVRYFIFYAVLINFFSTKKRLILIATSIVLSEFVFMIGALIYFYGVLGHSITTRFAEGFSIIAIDIIPFGLIMGALLAGVLFNLQKNGMRRLLLAGIIMAFAGGTILTHSRGAFLSLCISLAILFWKNKINLMMFFGVIVAITMQTPLKNRINPEKLLNDNARKALILYSLEIIKDHPIIGTGFAIDTFKDSNYIKQKSYESRLPKEYRTNTYFLWPHNMFLHMGVRTGIVGLVFFAGLFFVSILTCVRLILFGKDAFAREFGRCCLALVAMFLINGVLQPVFIHFLNLIFYTILGMVTIIWKINESIDVGVAHRT